MKKVMPLFAVMFALFFFAPTPSYAQGPSVTLNWNSVSVPNPGALSYKVYRALAPNGTFAVVSTGTLSATTYVDTTVVRGTSYLYRITANCPTATPGCGNNANGGHIEGESVPSNTVTANIPTPPVSVPPAPTNLTITIQP